MSQRNVEIIIGKLATDEELRRRFSADASKAILELVGTGLELSQAECCALVSTDPSLCEAFASRLDPRLQRASLKPSAVGMRAVRRMPGPLAALVGLLALAGSARAERPISLGEATELALRKNQDIAIERQSFRIAGDALRRASGAYDPSFHLEARYRDHTDPVNSLLSGAPPGEDAPRMTGLAGSASLAQLLPTGATASLSTAVSRDRSSSILTLLSPSYSTSFGLDLRQPLLQSRSIDPARRALRVARLDRDRSAASLKRTVAEIVAAVEKAYWTLTAAGRDVSVRRSAIELAERQMADTRARVDAGTLPESDLAQPAAEVQRRKGELYAAEESLRRAENQVKSLLLADTGDLFWAETLVPSDSPETTEQRVDLSAALKEAESARPEVADALAQLSRQEVEVAAAKDRVLPQLDLVASYARRGLAGGRSPNVPDSFFAGPVTVPDQLSGGLGRSFGTMTENRFPDASIGLALTVPLGNRAARADADAAAAGRTQAQINLARVKQLVSVEVRNAVVALQTAAQRIEAARSQRQAAETQLRAENERFGVGLSTNFLVLTRQNDLAQAQLTETASLTDYRKALSELARARGTLLPERKIQIDAPAQPNDGGTR